MSKTSQTHFDNMTLFVFCFAILLMGVWTRKLVVYAMGFKKLSKSCR